MSFDLRIQDGDLKIASDGGFEKVEGTDKLIQEILKIVHTPLGSNVFYPWYGSPISKSLVGQAMDMEFVSTVASNQLQTSLENLQRLQQLQMREQHVTPYEQLAGVKRITISRNQVDPRHFLVTIDVVSRALSVTSVQATVKPNL
jgi:phage baseplate assembly protein W